MSNVTLYLKKNKKMLLVLCISLITFILIIGSLYYFLLVPLEAKYQKGLTLLDNQNYIYAEQIFTELGNYKNSKAKRSELSSYLYIDGLINDKNFETAIKELNSIPYTSQTEYYLNYIYRQAIELKNQNPHTALNIFLRLKDYNQSREYANNLIKKIDKMNQISIVSGYKHTAFLDTNGSITFAGDNSYGQCNTQSWPSIQALYAEGNYTVGLTKQGKAVITGDQTPNTDIINKWANLKELCLFPKETHYKAFGLKKNGTVVSTSNNPTLLKWKQISHITCSDTHIAGLTLSGTVVATGTNDKGQCNVQDFKDIVDIWAKHDYTLGLKKDGTLTISGETPLKDRVINWTNIHHIWASDTIIVGLKEDGTLLAAGPNLPDNALASWKNITQIAVNTKGIIGLQLDGSLLCMHLNDLSTYNDLYTIHLGDYLFAGLKNGHIVFKETIKPPNPEDFIVSREPAIGMRTKEVKRSTWGIPDEIISTTNRNGTHEEWIYGNNRILFENGKVITIEYKKRFSKP